MFRDDRVMLLELEPVKRSADPHPEGAPEARRPEDWDAAGVLTSRSLTSPDRVRDDLATLGLLPVGRSGKGLAYFALAGFFRRRVHPRS